MAPGPPPATVDIVSAAVELGAEPDPMTVDTLATTEPVKADGIDDAVPVPVEGAKQPERMTGRRRRR